MSEINVFVEKCREDIELPTYANDGDAGMDIRAAIDIEIIPNQTVIIPTGLKMAIPKGYEIQVRPRSGVSAKTPLRVSNTPGTIDCGYKDEIGVIITNTSEFSNSFGIYDISEKLNRHGTYKIKKGDRIAQIVLKEVPKMRFTVVDDVSNLGSNRGGGFGSSGVK